MKKKRKRTKDTDQKWDIFEFLFESVFLAFKWFFIIGITGALIGGVVGAMSSGLSGAGTGIWIGAVCALLLVGVVSLFANGGLDGFDL